MKLLLLSVLAYGALGFKHFHKLEVDDAWEEWKEFFQYDASVVQENRHKDIFTRHHKEVNEHNARYNMGEETYFLALNEFAHLHENEFANDRLGTGYSDPKGLQYEITNSTNPTSVDWRTKGLVNAVKNQGQCGSCWAFSTIVSLEGQFAKATGKLPDLSEQDLVDCVKNVPFEGSTCCMGCQGGLMAPAFTYITASQSGNDDTESSYPYKGVNGQCKFNVSNDVKGVDVKSHTQGNGEAQLQNMVATVGPISVGVDANASWQLYGGGILIPKGFRKCSSNPNKMDHGVAVVGYDSNAKYWIVRNSWGPGWGEKGYMRLGMGGNYCGVANVPVYPNVETKN